MVTDNLDGVRFVRQLGDGVLKHLKKALGGKWFRDVFERVAGKGFRHVCITRRHKYEQAVWIAPAHPLGDVHTIHFFEINVHENDRISTRLEDIQKSLAFGEQVDLKMFVVLCSEFVAQKRHLLLIERLIFYDGYSHGIPLISLLLKPIIAQELKKSIQKITFLPKK
jgi:hypothetical protein